MDKDIGQIIVEARKKKKMSQEDVAEKLFVSRQAVSNWENNINIPDYETLKKLCKILDLDFNLLCDLGNYVVKKEKSKLNKIILILILMLILIIFFLMFLVKCKNKFEVYNIYFDSDEITINNGIFIVSNVNYYLQLGSITMIDDDINNYKIKLYYKNDNDIKVLIETNYSDSIILNEIYGYGEYFDDDFDISNCYIELASLTESQKILTYKLDFDLLFKSEKLFYFKHNNIIQNNELNENADSYILENVSIAEDSLINNGYILEGSDYIKEVDEGTFKYNLYSSILYFYDDISLNLEYRLRYDDIYGDMYSYDLEKYVLNFNYDNSSKKLTCYSETCDDYEIYVDFMLDEVNNIIKNKNASEK